MAALTAVPPSLAPSSTSRSYLSHMPRRRTTTPSSENWMNRQSMIGTPTELDMVRGVRSTSGGEGRHGAMSRASSITPSMSMSMVSTSQHRQRRVTHGGTSVAMGQIGSSSSSTMGPPAPIADVISARYAGIMSPPPNVPQPPPLPTNSPYISIFHNRYSGNPHDGDDSDDDEQAPAQFTVVENDWRKDKGPGGEGTGGEFERKGKWGTFKGAMSHIGRSK